MARDLAATYDNGDFTMTGPLPEDSLRTILARLVQSTVADTERFPLSADQLAEALTVLGWDVRLTEVEELEHV